MHWKTITMLGLAWALVWVPASAQRGLEDRSAPRAVSAQAPRNLALLIAVQSYPGRPPGWDALSTPVADAEAIREVLEARYGFEVTTAYDVTLDGIYEAFDRFEQKVRDGDRVLIYYAGHGQLESRTDEGFWIPRDGRRPENPASPRPVESRTWFPNEELKRLLKRLSRARHILVVSDACFSGQLGRGLDRGLREAWRKEREAFELRGPDAEKVRMYDSHLSRKVFASGRYDQVVADTGGFGHSPFAYYLLEALRNNTVSAIPAHALFSRVIENMDRDRRAGQIPNYNPIPGLGDAQGEFVFFSGGRGLPPPASAGTVRVSVNVGAAILIDGREYGQASAGQTVAVDVSAGTHTVRAEAAGYRADEQRVTVSAGGRMEVVLTLVALPGPPGPVVPPQAGGKGSLYIRSDPEGATVRIDGRAVGETPATATALSVGPHRVEVEMALYHPWEQMVQVEPGVKWLEPVALRPNFGSLKVDSEPPGALLYLSGQQMGRTPYAKDRVKSGSYPARLVLDWYHDYEGTVTVRDGEASDERIVLRPAFGSLVVRSRPSGAQVLIDGQEAGTTALDLPRVRSGRHVVRVEKDLYAPWEGQVEVIDGQSAEVFASLEARFGGLSVRSQPSGMPVEVDGRPVGKTPVRVHPIGAGAHRVVIGAGREGYRLYEGTVEVRVNETAEVSESLLPRLGNLTVFSEPAEGRVYIDGEEKGVAPVTLHGLLAGRHKIEVKKGELIYEGEVRIEEGTAKDFQCKLERPFRGGEMVYIPAGKFTMGSKHGDSDERPVHRVYLDAYYIDKTEVTVAQYREFARATGREMPGQPSWSGDDHPVVNVSWYDAKAYCEWAGKRLPAEAEWEKAARGTDGRKYPWGNVWDAGRTNAYGSGDGYAGTSPVGSFPEGASPYGVLDMSGNVWEWCADWYDGDYYRRSPKKNPVNNEKTSSYRMLRGGSWDIFPISVRCADRARYLPDGRSDNGGFRCAR